ncbi:MAG: glycosyltransferase family 39 protein [Rhodocyclaceae bacterium]|nr:glycosyltransferase family 39 protein [Rhodocyclaceae bacterium]
MQRLSAAVRAIGPVRTAFLASLLLSLIAVQGHLVNRDGIFYLETAQIIAESGLAEGLRTGAWGVLPALIALMSAVTPFGFEAAAHILDALFLAGACALLVAMVRHRAPEAAWAACLLVLAMPAYNQYRHEILREYGFWFFCMLAVWLVMRWQEAPRWREAIACQLALGMAALFRLEAVAFYPALMLWQGFAAPPGQRLRRALILGSLPLACAALAGVLIGSGLVALPNRVGYYLDAANPLRTFQILNEAGSRMSDLVFQYKYSREEAGYILFFGLLSVIPVKFLKMSGVFVVPLAYAFIARPAREVLARWQPLPWAILAYLLVLAAFVMHEFFLVGRYVSMLNLLALPVAAVGAVLLMQRFPRWKALMVAMALLTMAANVVSLTPKKMHIVEAGRWLAENVADRSQVCLANSRIAYYAGWRSAGIVFEGAAFDRVLDGGRCSWVAMEAKRKEYPDDWLKHKQLLEVRRFKNAGGDAVIIARREAAGQPFPSH